MNYNKKTINDVDVRGKKVLLRCDFNVPQDKVTGEITSDKRIKAAIPTIKQLLLPAPTWESRSLPLTALLKSRSKKERRRKK